MHVRLTRIENFITLSHVLLGYMASNICVLRTWSSLLITFDMKTFRPHQLHEIQTIAIDDPGVCLSVTQLHCIPKKKELQTQLNVLRYCWGWGSEEHCIGWWSQSPMTRGGGFDAAFAKLLWPYVLLLAPAQNSSVASLSNISRSRITNKWMDV